MNLKYVFNGIEQVITLFNEVKLDKIVVFSKL